jgi:hypothetical protein
MKRELQMILTSTQPSNQRINTLSEIYNVIITVPEVEIIKYNILIFL